jgi:hypothetical protein
MNWLKRSVSLRALILASLCAAPGLAQAKSGFNLGGALSDEDKSAVALPSPVKSVKFPQGPAPTREFILKSPELIEIFGVASEVEHSNVPERDPLVKEVDFDRGLFSGDPIYKTGYDPEAQIAIYGGKTAVEVVQPLLSLGRDELYGTGPVGEGYAIFGEKNRFSPQLVVFGDWRTAMAYNDNGNGDPVGQLATRLNLFFDLKLTATERILMFYTPLQNNGKFTRITFDDQNGDGLDFDLEVDDEPVTLFFEGDAGAIIAGVTDEFQSYDMPIAFGRVPLFFQNGIWFDDAFLGGAFTIPAQNSALFDITNYDITFFAGGAEITSDAFTKPNGAGGVKNDDNEAAMIGAIGFFDVAEGYLEVGAAYLHDKKQSDGDESYLNLTAAFSKRYGGFVSNATRVFMAVGQEEAANTADGTLLIIENALITHLPLTLIPYGNFFIGKGSPQAAAKGDGILKNVGLAFETDALTGFPKLDDDGRDTLGGAIGVQYLFGLDQQLVVEAAAVFPWDNENGNIQDNQFALSVRYQRPLSNQWIFRTDAIYGHLIGAEDIFGARVEMRYKF